MPNKLIAGAPRSVDHVANILKFAILLLAAADAGTMLGRYGFVNFADWHHFIPAAAANDFAFTG